MNEKLQPSDFHFNPDGKLWEVDRENALVLFGGQRALLMQLAHPLVGQAISDHSYFKKDAIGRLKNTLDLTYELIFGTNEGSFQAASVINRTHGYVHGELKKGVGVYVEGTSYDAHDPELLQWVWATLVDSAMLVHNKFVRPLSPDESEIYYQETKGLLTPLGGIPGETPQTHEDFTEYIAEQIRSGKVRVSSEANDLAPYVLLQDTKPKKLASLPLARVAIGLLPDELREQYGYSFSSLERSVLDKSATISRKIHPYLPTVARFSPKYRKAMKQLGR